MILFKQQKLLRVRETHENSNYLLVRIPIEIANSFKGSKRLSMQQGERKLVVNVTKLGEFLDLSTENVDRLAPLLSRPPPKEKRPVRKKIDYVALRKGYEKLLMDGTPAAKADVVLEPSGVNTQYPPRKTRLQNLSAVR